MSDSGYEDDRCTYVGGDLRFEKRLVQGKLVLSEDDVRFQGEDHTISWPKRDIHAVSYAPTLGVDIDYDGLVRAHGVNAAQDIDIALGERLSPDPALSIRVADPEGVNVDGFDVRIIFRDSYYAKVFGKRVEKAFGVPFESDQE